MGVFYYIHSVALIEDLPLHEHYADPNVFYQEADAAYSQVNAYEIKNFYKTWSETKITSVIETQFYTIVGRLLHT